ncbi:hypothetical protein GGI07_003766 [Coemansia sp. Benny D115]|nr:hypothetical protein GGI07_003766 [Coemansia sp. Benny D115]
MKFGKTIESSAKELPQDWQPYIIQYKLLKKNIKRIVEELDDTFRTLSLPPPHCSGEGAIAAEDATDASEGPSLIPVGTIDPDGGSGNSRSSTGSNSGGDGGAERSDGVSVIADSHEAREAVATSLQPQTSTAEIVSYTIEKDDSGVVHPVITVRVRKPIGSAQASQVIELPDVAGLPKQTSILLPDPVAPEGDVAKGQPAPRHCDSNIPEKAVQLIKDPNPLAENAASAYSSSSSSSNILIETSVLEDFEETQVTVRLETDQMFFDKLIGYIERMREFEQSYTKQYNGNVTALGGELTAVTSPFKHDFQIWREIFRLYLDADVWDHADGDFRQTNSAKQGQDRFAKFTEHIEAMGLTKGFRDPLSAKLLVSFYKLNSELTYLKLLQEMNELAMRKILKKHDKRTHLVSKTQFPQIATIDTSTLIRALIYTIHTDLVGVVPQIDDYLCPMCLNIAWRPLRLDCAHVFCSRCVVKASRRCIFDCPVCRAKDAIYKAGVSNIDNALLNFLKLYFPREVKEKQRDIQQEISRDEAQVILSTQSRDRPCIIM